MKKIFESPHYPKIMYLSIVITLLLIFFTFMDILNQANEIKISGFAIENNENND